ncbi:Triosephosphate isomerase, cytosolic [Camellia lanceoleosa]|uniref:Triosephosphate isomerase, cytosolic n=1 Tax=Camellia lanceoleosa TaxID=1840588 RepID=A0ACC0H057_9ERIC|nr:Triosephosphate isomerase, cytosolic [Camellia lanceoleosa]
MPNNVGDLEKQPFYRFLQRTYVVHPIALAVLLYAMGGLPFIVWGMNGTSEEVKKIVSVLNAGEVPSQDVVEVVVSPPYVFLPLVKDLLRPDFHIAAQNYWVKKGGKEEREESSSSGLKMRNSWGFLAAPKPNKLDNQLASDRLDIGDGKEVDLKECPRSKLRQQCIKYLGPTKRKGEEEKSHLPPPFFSLRVLIYLYIYTIHHSRLLIQFTAQPSSSRIESSSKLILSLCISLNISSSQGLHVSWFKE